MLDHVGPGVAEVDEAVGDVGRGDRLAGGQDQGYVPAELRVQGLEGGEHRGDHHSGPTRLAQGPGGAGPGRGDLRRRG